MECTYTVGILAGHVCYHPDGYVWVPGEGGFRVVRGSRPFELGRVGREVLPHSGWRSLGAWTALMRNAREE